MYRYLILSICLFTVFSGCKTTKGEPSDTNQKATTVLVQLNNKDSISELEQNFKKYNLGKEKVVSKPMHIYLFTFNTKKITDKALVELLKLSDLVKEAQQNKNVQTRNTN